MASAVAPWLQGLEDAWEVPAGVQIPPPANAPTAISSATHDADSLGNGSVRMPKHPQHSVRSRRSPLAHLSNGSNISRRQTSDGPAGKLTESRSFSAASDGSMMQCGTVQQRSKSASPKKSQETLEWRRRLVRGQVGYGDQTDLFGPSGLENIFAQTPQGEGSSAPKNRKRMNWMDRSAPVSIPSSPPPWPSHVDLSQSERVEEDEERLTTVGEGEEDDEGTEAFDHALYAEEDAESEGKREHDSYRSNPFEEGPSQESQNSERHISPHELSSPERFEPTPGHQVGNRTISGRTELEEDFSPVFISKHTTINGTVGYTALDSHTVKQFQEMDINLQHPDQEGSTYNEGAEPQETAGPEDRSKLSVDQSTFTDGDSIATAAPDLSLSENLPTGTPEGAGLGGNVQLKRGGYSAEGSFRERPLSASPEREESSFLSPMPPRSKTSAEVRRDHVMPSTPHEEHEPAEPRSRSSGSPLKLFGPHDTFTSNRLLRRLSQLDPDLSAIRSEAGSEPRYEAADNSQTSTPVRRDHSFAQSFGSGSLNNHPFPAEITITGASDESEEALDSDLSPGSDVPPPGSRMPMLFKLESSPDTKNAFRVKRKTSRQTTSSSKKTTVHISRSGSRKTSQPLAFLQATVEDASDMVSTFEAAAEKVSERRSSSKHLFANPSAESSRDASQQPSSPAKRSNIPKLRGPTGNVRDTSEQPTPGKMSSIPVAVGKRPPNSPFKAPTPKRRRTLHASELEVDTAEVRRSYHENVENEQLLKSDAADANRSYHEQLQEAISSQKRRSLREDDEQMTAEADVLAQRKILRPRNPTPSQRPGPMNGRVPSTRKEQIEAEIREATEAFATQEPEAMEAVLEQMETSMASGSPPTIQQQARAVATEVAKFTLRVQKASAEHVGQERKRSVTTQDFFNEAVMVMRLIREKAGRQSGLGSVAESDQEGNDLSPSEEFDNSMLRDGSPMLRVSRPPSREGATSGWRPRTSANTDARVISHLRRFQENDDTEFIAPSIASLRVGADEHEEEDGDYEDEDEYDEDDEHLVAVDEHSNIRIKGPLTTRHEEDIDSRPSSQRSDHNTLHTQSTQSQSSIGGRSINTSCTKKSSDNVGNLAPDAVAHLIGEQVGGMVFDKDKQQWVRVRTSPKKKKRGYGSFLEPPSDVTSSDDPFGEISDLPVDERKEEEIRRASAQRSRAVSTDNRMETAKVDVQVNEKRESMQAQIESRTSSQETVIATTRPTTSDSNKSRHTYSSSDPTRHTGFSSSQQLHETRATSWGNEELELLAKQGKTVAKEQPLVYAAAQAALSLAQKQESMKTRAETGQQIDTAQLPERTNEMIHEDSDVLAELRDDTELADGDSELPELPPPKIRPTPLNNHYTSQSTKSQSTKSHSTFRSTRQVSLRRKTLTSRFNDADALEHSELSFIAALPGERMMSVNLSVSRPLSARTQGHIVEASSPSKFADPSFFFSDLPDFTISEEDAERPSEQVLAKRLAQHAADEVNDRYALAVKDIVKTLTDVYEQEPYWETMKNVDLRDRTVTTLHGLEEFCGSVQQLDVSKNKLAYLTGAPATVRSLNARENQLSSLTCWTHLMNLQYVDISGNRLDNLDGLACLYHLRELRVDDNVITNVNGIADLDGLLKLRLRRNRIASVDFGATQLQRLEELDLCGNQIETIQNLHELQSLKSLKLDGNRLNGTLEIQDSMPNLKSLSLRNCGLQRLDVSHMPNLQALLLDGNSLADVENMEDLQSLELFSMRNQSLPSGSEISILSRPLAARVVRLSGTNIANFDSPTSQLSIQQLEMASVGLQELPSDFGLKFPNLVQLNLNFNTLRDIRPLLNIQKLKVLNAAGNMLGRLRKTVATLSLLPTLTDVDIRDNPLTQGFYAPHTGCGEEARVGSVVRKSSISEGEDADEDEEYERRTAATFHLPVQSNAEGKHLVRLDEGVKLRRRVYEILVSQCCPAIRMMDGTVLDRGKAMQRDEVWEKLVELKVMKKCGDGEERCRIGIKSPEVQGRIASGNPEKKQSRAASGKSEKRI